MTRHGKEHRENDSINLILIFLTLESLYLSLYIRYFITIYTLYAFTCMMQLQFVGSLFVIPILVRANINFLNATN